MNELINFAMYLTGHNQVTVKQMYRDWIGQRIIVKGFNTYYGDILFSNFKMTKKDKLLEIDNGTQKAMIKLRISDLNRFRTIVESEGLFVVYGTTEQLCVILDSL